MTASCDPQDGSLWVTPYENGWAANCAGERAAYLYHLWLSGPTSGVPLTPIFLLGAPGTEIGDEERDVSGCTSRHGCSVAARRCG